MASTTSPRLTILGGPLAGRELTLDEAVDNILIGSDPSCRFHIDLPGISPIHARLWVDWQGLTVYDTGTPEGVYLNDDRVERSMPVHNGDILWLGTPGGEGVVMIQCRVPARAPAEAAAAPVTSTPTPAPAEEPVSAAFDEPVEILPEEPAPGIDTVQITAPAERTSSAPPVEDMEDDGATLVLAAAPDFDSQPPLASASPAVAPPAAWVSEDPVRFELDTPAPPAPVEVTFEEDIDETALLAAQATTSLPVSPALPATPPPAPTVAPALVSVPAPVAPPKRPEPAARPASAPATTPAPVVRPTPAPGPAPAPRAGSIPRAVSSPTSAPTRSSGGAGKLIGALALLALLVVAGLLGYRLLPRGGSAQPPTPASTPSVLPSASAPTATDVPDAATPAPLATPPIEESVTVVPGTPTPAPGATPTPRPSATPRPSVSTAPSSAPAAAAGPSAEALRAQQTAAQVSSLLTQGDGALAERRYDAAAGFYGQVLQLEPQNAAALRGRAEASAGQAAARRTFVAGRSSLQGAKSGKRNVAGFESEDVEVAKSPDYSGRIDFEVSPRSVRPGDAYTVKVYLLNDGKKDFKIAAFSAVTVANGERSGGAMPSAARDIDPQKRALVQEISGTWKDGTNAWSLEVTVTSGHGEVVRNTLTWR